MSSATRPPVFWKMRVPPDLLPATLQPSSPSAPLRVMPKASAASGAASRTTAHVHAFL